MKRGAWHQCGDKSQRLVEEQLEAGHGVGVVLSPRDLKADALAEFAAMYRGLGADVIVDTQFYVPDFSNKNLQTYTISKFRQSVSALHQISEPELSELSAELEAGTRAVHGSAVVAPAVLYEAGRHEIVQLNARLFGAAKSVGDALGVPTYATIGLAKSVTGATKTVTDALNAATALPADGWYYAFEFEDERIPSARDAVYRCCEAGLTLAATAKPVLHAYGGPMGLLSFGFGASGVGIGHSQNLWKFTRDRWEPPAPPGKRKPPPPRFFSQSLWGTIVYPDESVQLSATLRAAVLAPSTPFCGPVHATPPRSWSSWDAKKHMLCVQAQTFASLAKSKTARAAATAAGKQLKEAVALHARIKNARLKLKDNTNAYQENWRLALSDLLKHRSADFDYMEL